MCQKSLSIFSKIVSIAVILTALVAAVRVQAATVTSANDVVTTLAAGAAANHELLFTTPSGLSEGETLTVTFDAGFSIASLTEDDVDLADDGVELTTAASCAGSEQASVATASNTITFTICTGDGGSITAASVVRVRIGSNAVSSGTGTNRVVNPSAARNHFVSIAGSFGDVGSIILPIQSSTSAIAIGATITAPPTGGGGGGNDGGCTENCDPENQVDAIAPVISQLVVSQITKTSAVISWTTNEDASSRVVFGLTDALDAGFVHHATLLQSHAVTLTNLQEGTTYFFHAKSADVSNNVATSATMTFRTVDETAPIISNVAFSSITQSSVTVSWTTNENATSVLDYGLTNAYGANRTNATLTSSHSVTLTGLQSGATYHVRIRVKDVSLNEAVSADQTVSTLPNLPPANVSGLTVSVGDRTLVLSWVNPSEEDFAGVRILRCGAAFPSGPADTNCTNVAENLLAGSLTQTGLTNGITYYYGVFAKDLSSQFASGALVSGKPSAPELEVPIGVCGDNVCSATESISSCSLDCSPPEPPDPQGPVCGDNLCVSPETRSSCPADCAVQTPNPGEADACGNGICGNGESTFTCASDCKNKDTSQAPGSGADAFTFSDVTFFVGNGAITLRQVGNSFDVLGSTPLSVRVPATRLSAGVDRVTLMIGKESFILRPVEKMRDAFSAAALSLAASTESASVLSYEADVLSPAALSLHPATIFVEYTDGNTTTVSSFLRVVAPGVTVESTDGEEAFVAGVSVTLYTNAGSSGAVWDGSPYGAWNPTTSSANGSFAWYVPNGRYFVRAEQSGYASVDTPVLNVTNNIVNPRILLTLLPLEEETPKETATDAVISLVANQESVKQITAAVQRITESKAVQAVSKGLEDVRSNPTVQTAADISVPALALSAGSSVLVMSVAFDFLPFIQYLFTAPVLFFGRRKRKAFGVIYNAVSKEPIGLAVVRLYQVKDAQELPGKLVKSRVTDKGGRFFFLVQPGLYRLTVTKVGFSYPSVQLKTKNEDVPYIDLYHGELLRVTEADAVITPNIPVDPSSEAKYQEPKSIQWRARLRVIQHIIALSGVLLSIGFFLIRPNVLAAVMMIIQIGVYALVQRLAKPRKPKSWGIVYDKETGRPLANVVARIFEPKYNKLLETQVTDSKGRYSFLLGPAEYYAVFEKEGYRSTQVKPIDFTKDKESKDFSMDINLFTKETEPPPTPSPS